MPGGGILALDLSSRTGWAYGRPGDARPLCGVWVLPRGGLGRMLASFENELDDAITVHRPRLLFVEAPLPPGRQSGMLAVRQQLGLAGAAESTAYRHGLRYREQAASTVRRAVLGTARFAPGTVKGLVLDHCRRLGWPAPDDNAADACLAWAFACGEARPAGGVS